MPDPAAMARSRSEGYREGYHEGKQEGWNAGLAEAKFVIMQGWKKMDDAKKGSEKGEGSQKGKGWAIHSSSTPVSGDVTSKGGEEGGHKGKNMTPTSETPFDKGWIVGWNVSMEEAKALLHQRYDIIEGWEDCPRSGKGGKK